MKNKKLSICIPTYNRILYLKRLLDNIVSQDCNKIEVVIVNDGSSDNTDDLVKIYKGKIDISYIKQKNAGRGLALKKAIELAKGEYTLIMDDEDLFTKTAFNIIIHDLEKYCGKDNNIIGICYLTSDIDNKLIGSKFPNTPFISNLVSIIADYNVKGDKKQVVKTKHLKDVLYDTYIGERRVPTYLLWSRLSQYNVVFINEIVAIKEYLDDGLTKNINRIRMKSPQGSRIIYKELFEKKPNIYKSKSYRLKNSINFFRYNFHSKKKTNLKGKFSFGYKFLGFLLGYILYKKDLLEK